MGTSLLNLDETLGALSDLFGRPVTVSVMVGRSIQVRYHGGLGAGVQADGFSADSVLFFVGFDGMGDHGYFVVDSSTFSRGRQADGGIVIEHRDSPLTILVEPGLSNDAASHGG